jgi:acyl carrier protein
MGPNAVVTEGRDLLLDVSEVVAAVAKVPPPYAGGEHLYNELGLESVQALSLLLALEERFGVSLDDQSFVKCTTVSSLTDLIRGSRDPGARS